MAYRVRYAFGKDREVTLDKMLNSIDTYIEKPNIFLRDTNCFSAYTLYRGLQRQELLESSVFYQLSCNPTMLEKMVKWINSFNSGITIDIVDVRNPTAMVSFNYGSSGAYKSFDPKAMPLIISIAAAEKEDLEYLDISRCCVEIKIDTDNIYTKACQELIILVLLRFLDINEEYLMLMLKRPKNVKLVKKLVDSNNVKNAGHSLYNFGGSMWAPVYGCEKLTIELLEAALNVQNVQRAVNNAPINDYNIGKQKTSRIIYQISLLLEEAN